MNEPTKLKNLMIRCSETASCSITEVLIDDTVVMVDRWKILADGDFESLEDNADREDRLQSLATLYGPDFANEIRHITPAFCMEIRSAEDYSRKVEAGIIQALAPKTAPSVPETKVRFESTPEELAKQITEAPTRVRCAVKFCTALFEIPEGMTDETAQQETKEAGWKYCDGKNYCPPHADRVPN